MKSIITALILFISANIHATTIAQVPIEKMLKDADIVAVVTIVSGEVIVNKSTRCGAKYKVKIDSLIKGKLELQESNIEFGISSYKIGEQYLAFLKRTKSRMTYLGSTNSRSERQRINKEAKCKDVYPEFRVVHASFGMFELGAKEDPDFKGDELTMTLSEMFESGWHRDTLLVYPRYVHVPDSIRKYDVDDRTCWSHLKGCVWVDMADLFSSLGYKYKKFDRSF